MAPGSPDRRSFLKVAGLAALEPWLPRVASTATPQLLPESNRSGASKPDHVLSIRAGRVDLGPGHVIVTATFNGQFPGPLLRTTAGQRLIVDVRNDTDALEYMQWPAQYVEGALPVPARLSRRFELTPQHGGISFYHSDQVAAADPSGGLYGGLAGPLLIEPRHESGRFDREVLLVLKEFEPYVYRTAREFIVGYRACSINGRMLGHGEPIRVSAGQRVLFHVLNASATEFRTLAFAGHLFHVLALDGYPVPTPASTRTLSLAPGERISAIVKMDRPGIWICGDPRDEERARGMGIIVEYAGRSGTPLWHVPVLERWDYGRFSAVGSAEGTGSAARPGEPEGILEVVLARTDAVRGGFNRWTVNGKWFDASPPPNDESRAAYRGGSPLFRIRCGSRYRLRLHNLSEVATALQLRGHRLELMALDERPIPGIAKDVVTVGTRARLEVAFTAQRAGAVILESTQRLHRDFGLMARIDCVQA